MKYLLVEPNFPIPIKSKNHKDFLPIGLLKIAALKKQEKHQVILARGNLEKNEIFDLAIKQINYKKSFLPNEIWITSLFTYWINDVTESVLHYRSLFKKSKIIVGGIAASLFGEEKTKKITGCDDVKIGVIPEAENLPISQLKDAYDRFLNSVDFQILHGQRGCFRRCSFCGTWIIEPEVKYEKSIKEKIFKRKIVFYDNNFLDNPNIHNILDELIELKKSKKILWCESQSGFDGRLLTKDITIAPKLKAAGFRNIRIAWDGKFDDYSKIKKQLDSLTKDRELFRRNDIEIFMLYNWNIPFDEMEKKRVKCFEWGVQISDCRFRPLDQTFDNYNPRKLGQLNSDYYIHEKWNDLLVKQFRRNVRRHNICIRHGFHFYVKDFESKKADKEIITRFVNTKIKEEQKQIIDEYGLSFSDLSNPKTVFEVQQANTESKLRLLD